VTLTDLIPALRGNGSRRAASPAELRDENRKLLNRQMAADDYFALLVQDRAEVYACWEDERRKRQEADQAAAQMQSERDEAIATVQRIDDHYNATIVQLQNELAEAERRLEIGVMAEAAAARTQEIDVRDLRDNYADGVLTLQQAHCIGPVLDPGHVKEGQ